MTITPKTPQRLTPEGFRVAQRNLHLSNEAIAEALGVSRATVAKWRRGSHPIPRIVTRAVRDLQAEARRQMQAELQRGANVED